MQTQIAELSTSLRLIVESYVAKASCSKENTYRSFNLSLFMYKSVTFISALVYKNAT